MEVSHPLLLSSQSSSYSSCRMNIPLRLSPETPSILPSLTLWIHTSQLPLRILIRCRDTFKSSKQLIQTFAPGSSRELWETYVSSDLQTQPLIRRRPVRYDPSICQCAYSDQQLLENTEVVLQSLCSPPTSICQVCSQLVGKECLLLYESRPRFRASQEDV
jgi:hypothetical protein